MGRYWDQSLLRDDPVFDRIIEEVVRAEAEAIMANEPETSPINRARRAIASRVLTQRDDVVAAFHRELKNLAVRQEPFRVEAFKAAKPDASGAIRPRAQDIPDAMLEQGVQSVWNDVTLLAWPDILKDIEPEA